jgi:hypothetical protein
LLKIQNQPILAAVTPPILYNKNTPKRRYNFCMPTPFYHLFLAEVLLKSHGLPEDMRVFLCRYREQFLFGNTAPDVQVISGQPRQETHFFNLPIKAGDQPAWEKMLSEQPGLHAKRLPLSKFAFIAGYLCHIQADWLWIRDVFSPIFGPQRPWATFKQRLYYHNVLRAYLDSQILAKLPVGLDDCLSRAQPSNWLPFAQDHYLGEWRDYLSEQLKMGAHIQTVEIFSSRQGISAKEYYSLLASDERMTKEVFSHLPCGLLETYDRQVLNENIQLLTEYLAPRLQPVYTANQVNLIHGAQP